MHITSKVTIPNQNLELNSKKNICNPFRVKHEMSVQSLFGYQFYLLTKININRFRKIYIISFDFMRTVVVAPTQ